MDDDLFLTTPASMSSSKPLRINLDLRLYRARLARMQAALAVDPEAKRQLLRQAEASLRTCLAMDSSDARGYVVLGKLLAQQKRYDEARKLYADGTTATGNTSAYIWAAWGYLEALTGNVARARKLFDAAIVVDETHAAAWHKWGMLEMRQGNYLRARDLWTSGISKCRRVSSRSNTYLYCSLAVMAAELGKLSEARAWFQEGTRLAEGRCSCALWHAWAMTEARLGDPSAVRYLFKRSLEANPRSRYAHLAWAMWERQQGNAAASLQLLARGSSLNPADAALYQARGIVEKEAGRCEQARAVFKQGLSVDAAHLYLWQAWGVMEFQLGRFDEARRLFQEGVWADPGNKDVVFIFQAWGVLEQRTGNAALARELFKAALKAFKDAVYLSSCRGKLWHDKPAALGPLRDWAVPQAWFLHFYVVGSCCNAAVLLAYCLSSAPSTSGTHVPLLALLLVQLHLVRRALETWLLLHYPCSASMHGIAYVFGLSYYAVVPLSLLPSSWYSQQQWQQLGPLQQLRATVQQHLAGLADSGALTQLQLMGAGVFLAGNLLQLVSHWQLAALSRGSKPGIEETAYKVPTGGLFELVSCPHYLAEIIIYCGLLLVTGGQLLPLLMLVWVAVNLVLAARASHKWYRRRFKSYPPARKAIIPFVL
ncbi:hypothetical protein OEZ85_014071 [Tetradesmus obliquus]|uniref:3-oxo-5-alpha-steroid 4-dehydrogenase C-terminal domain-containing protein n=1 Tax=Tetradesmus obliquus TaxID=3088 RepID=A0ABY8U6U1_TETOB|nr:hypothetical protein OEZ85_014071 [Tetradesmus obliquus]